MIDAKPTSTRRGKGWVEEVYRLRCGERMTHGGSTRSPYFYGPAVCVKTIFDEGDQHTEERDPDGDDLLCKDLTCELCEPFRSTAST